MISQLRTTRTEAYDKEIRRHREVRNIKILDSEKHNSHPLSGVCRAFYRLNARFEMHM